MNWMNALLNCGIAVVILPTLSLPVSAAPIRLTLEESVRQAVQSSTVILKSRNNVELTGSQVLQGYAQFFPTSLLRSSTDTPREQDPLYHQRHAALE